MEHKSPRNHFLRAETLAVLQKSVEAMQGQAYANARHGQSHALQTTDGSVYFPKKNVEYLNQVLRHDAYIR